MTYFDMSSDVMAQYKGSVVRPDDFDAFWANTLEEARCYPIDAQFKRFDADLSLVEVFDVSFAGHGGNRIQGWLIVPAGKKDQLPVVISYIGYGGGRGFPHEHLIWPVAGYACFVMDTRGQGSAWGIGDTPDPVGSAPSHPGFATRGILDRDTYYYGRLITDAVRAVDAVLEYPGIDRSRIAVYGASQGGALSLATAALHPMISAVMADVPFLCDFPRAVLVAAKDPYQEISRYLSVHRDKTDIVFETLRYFDCVCLAPLITAPALMSVADLDLTCPPSTVHATYNSMLSSDKRLVQYGYNDHEGGGAHQQRAQLIWLAQRFQV